MSSLPEVVIEDGPPGATPVYRPARDARVPGFGDHTLSVTVPGSGDFEDATLVRPLHVRRRRITVTARPATMPLGGPLPKFQYALTWGALVGGDELSVEWDTEATKDSPVNPAGYPLRPRVSLARGIAANYEIVTIGGCVKVHRGLAALEAHIRTLRNRWLALPKTKQAGALSDALDEIAKSRLDDRLAEVEDQLRSLELDIIEAEYVPVTGLTITAPKEKPLAGTAVKLEAKIEPANATEPAFDWSINDSAFGAIAADGTLTIAAGTPAAGLRVTATSRSREQTQSTLPLAVQPLPTGVEWIDPPTHLFFGDTVALKARVLPPEAAQAVEFRMPGGGQRPKNVDFQGKAATLAVTEPSASGGSRRGYLRLRAQPKDLEDLGDNIPVTFGGYRVRNVELKATSKEVVTGATIKVTCTVNPKEADQDVTWSIDSGEVARLENESSGSVDVVTVGSGPVKLTATASGGVQGEVTLVAKKECKNFHFTADKPTADVTESFKLTGVFDPPEARGRIDWELKPAGIAKMDGNVVLPLKAGKVSVKGTLPGTKLTHSLELTVTTDEKKALGPDSWKRLKELVDKYAGTVKLKETTSGANAYSKWIYDMQKDVEAAAKTPTLEELAKEIRTLRDKHYKLTHDEWLEKAGFASGGNCYIRSNSTLNHGGQTYSVHMTQFPTGADIEIGDDFDALESKVYRENKTGFVSMHATLYLDSTKSRQLKTFVSGENWIAPYTTIQSMGGHVAYNDLKADLEDWMNDNRDEARTGLEDLYDSIKENDTEKIVASV
jgi:hypothetical protein